MCLWFACFGLHKHRDDWDAPPIMGAATLPPPPATKPPHGRPSPHSVYGGAPKVTYNYNGVHRASPHQAAAEAGHKASNDARKGPAAAEAWRQPAAGVAAGAGEAAGHGAARHYRYHEREPVHSEDAMDDHHYSTAANATTTTTDHERY